MTKRKNRSQAGKRNKPSRSADNTRRVGGELWIYGKYAALAAIRNPARKLHRIMATRAIEEKFGEYLPPQVTQIVDRGEITARLADDAVHQGIAVHADPLPEPALGDLLDATAERAGAVLVILDQATDPRNVGAVMRSAAAFGCAGVVVHKHHAPPETGALAKTASGALETVPLVRAGNLSRAMNEIKEAGFWCIGLDGGAEETLAAVVPSGRTALVLGAEGAGLRRLTAETCDRLARIPISANMESLNLSNAAAIALYELARAD